jgi:lysozyme
MIARLRDEMIRDEGLVLHAYQDSLGYVTIGVGRLIDKRRGGGITKDEAMVLLDNDLAACIGDLRGSFPWFDKMNEARQCAVVNMRFNLGSAGFRTFKNTILALERKDYITAARNIRNSKAAKQTGKRYYRIADAIESGL